MKTPLTVPALPFSSEELRHGLNFVQFLQSDELKTTFQAIADADFTDFDPETLSPTEAERLLSFLQIAEFFVPFAAQQPILQSLVPAEIWKALNNVYLQVKPQKQVLEMKIKEHRQPKNSDYWENYRKNHKPMTIQEQIAFQEATKPKLKLEDVLGKWPGEESYEEIVDWLQKHK